MNVQKILNLLGMAQKAGKLVSGDFAVTRAAEKKNIYLLLAASDAADSTKERYQQLAKKLNIEIFYPGDREMLGHCIGKDFRAIVAVMDEGFANAIAKHCLTEM